MKQSKVGVLFVCLGNICRSPMAEAVFRKMVRDAGLDDSIHIGSAGTGDWHIGSRPHHGTIKVLDQYRIDHSDIVAAQLKASDFDDYQYIICMDEDNVRNAKTFTSKPYSGQLIRLLELVENEPLNDVPDPYFNNNFQQTYDLVNEGCKHLLQRIRTTHDL